MSSRLLVTPIGVNDAFTVEGFQTAYLLECGGTRLLVDCGTTAARSLSRLDLTLADIEAVYVSHIHLDHVGGLPELALQRYILGRERPLIYLHASLTDTLWGNFLSGVLGSYVDKKGVPRKAAAETFFRFMPVNNTCQEGEPPTTVGAISLRLVPMRHVEGAPSFGIVANDTVLITSDTTFMPELLEEVANRFGLQAIFHDCSFRSNQHHVHATYDELLSLPNDLKSLLILTHYEQDYRDHLKGNKKLELTLAEAGVTHEFR